MGVSHTRDPPGLRVKMEAFIIKIQGKLLLGDPESRPVVTLEEGANGSPPWKALPPLLLAPVPVPASVLSLFLPRPSPLAAFSASSLPSRPWQAPVQRVSPLVLATGKGHGLPVDLHAELSQR